MASTKISIPKYHLHRGSGQAFIQIKGKRHYLGKFDSPQSKEAYSRFVAELAVDPVPTTPTTTPKESLTVLELIAAYRPAIHKNEHHGKTRIGFVGMKAQAVLPTPSLHCVHLL